MIFLFAVSNVPCKKKFTSELRLNSEPEARASGHHQGSAKWWVGVQFEKIMIQD